MNWLQVLDTLQNQMGKATFTTHLQGSKLHKIEGNHFTVSVVNESSKAWIESRLNNLVAGAIAAVYGVQPTITYIVQSAADLPQINPPHLQGSSDKSKGVFSSPEANWTRTPDVFFDVVMPNSKPTVTAIVGAIIRKTLGITDKRGNSREWWESVSYSDIANASGVSIRSVNRAVKVALDRGYIKRRESEDGKRFDYSIRYEWE